MRSNNNCCFEQYRHTPTPISKETLYTVHCPLYVEQFINGTLDHKAQRRIGFPWSTELVTRTLHAVNGTRLCAELALEYGISVHLTGGYHHAHYDFWQWFLHFQ